MLIWVWGIVFSHTDQLNVPPNWSSYVITGLVIIQLLLGYTLKGSRWFATAVVLLEQWITLALAFFAFMSVTGEWL